MEVSEFKNNALNNLRKRERERERETRKSKNYKTAISSELERR